MLHEAGRGAKAAFLSRLSLRLQRAHPTPAACAADPPHRGEGGDVTFRHSAPVLQPQANTPSLPSMGRVAAKRPGGVRAPNLGGETREEACADGTPA
jgi:hypothetical protein